MLVEQCSCKIDRNCECGDCQTQYVHFTSEEIKNNNEYICALERTRGDLWGVNEELRSKIASLERGQEDLQKALEFHVMSPTPFNLSDALKMAGVGFGPIHE